MVIFFFAAAVPAMVASGVAVLVFDRLIDRETSTRASRITREVNHIIREERRRVSAKLEAIVTHETVRALTLKLRDANGLADAESLAADRAVAHGLDVLGIAKVAVDDGTSEILSSAHLPMSIGDPAPPFASIATSTTPVFGFAHELVEANPPKTVPVLMAVVTLSRRSARGAPRLVVYAGTRLDDRRFEDLARVADATLVLTSADLEPLVFPQETEPALRARALERGSTIRLMPIGEESATKGSPAELRIYVHTTGLEEARETFLELAAWLVVASLLVGFIASRVVARHITRPILDLASAARKVGAGDLEVHVTTKSRDEVGILVGVFNGMTREIAESRHRIQRAERIAAWREVARRVAHEIKNPLFPIQMSIETLRKSYAKKHEKFDAIFEESTRTVLEEVRALNQIVTEFSEFARLPAPRRTDVPALDLIDHIQRLYANRGPEASARGEVVIDRADLERRGLPTLSIDRDQVSRALLNLVKNGLEALPEHGGVVRIDAEPMVRGGLEGVTISVSDTGSGIDAEHRAKLFTPYFTTKTEGTGLGLAIVHRIIEEHGGAIDVESVVGSGTTFRLWFPAHPPDVSQQLEPSS
ncbi:MAG: HAMP domain-containing protein [Deltaproteobacteria bacterium]|nr:HAMP domain-containing protein [Deltaproteobacteria bacterium]